MLPLVLVKVWAIVEPLPAEAPVTLLVVTVQLKLVPATLFGLLIAMLVVSPLQIVWLMAATVGIGFTVTITSFATLTQPVVLLTA